MNKFIQTALAMDEASLQWRAKFTPEQAVEFCSKALAYNDFSAEDLVNFVHGVNNLVPRKNYGKINGAENPMNGTTHHHFLIGNENSRVIYLEIVKAYLPKDFNYKVLENELFFLSKKANANEFHVIENDEHAFEVRFWWD